MDSNGSDANGPLIIKLYFSKDSRRNKNNRLCNSLLHPVLRQNKNLKKIKILKIIIQNKEAMIIIVNEEEELIFD